MTEEERELEIWRDALASVEPSAAPGDVCPERDLLARAAAGELAEEAAGPVLDHAATCPLCAESWRLARAVEAVDENELRAVRDALVAATKPRPAAQLVPEPATRGWKDWLRGAAEWLGGPVEGGSAAPAGEVVIARRAALRWATAAGLLLAFGWAGFRMSPGLSRVRGGGAEDVQISSSTSESLPRDEFVLEWSCEVPDAEFLLEVTAGPRSLPVDFQRGLREARWVVAQENLAGVPSGEMVTWRVGVVLAERVEWSPNFVVRLE